MHQLIELDRIEELLRTAESFPGGNGLVVNVGGFTRSILKFSSLSVGEVFGYEMAKPLGVVPDPFLTTTISEEIFFA